jgi:integrase
MRILLDGVPFGVPDIHFDSHANIIVTNAKLQASRWTPSRPPLHRIAREDKSLACPTACHISWRMCEALGLPAITWHSFRHTHTTLLGEVGELLRTAQAILGHSDLATTLNVYTRAIPESQRRAVDKVADILFADVRKVAATV